jgi:hypothetical protein
MSRAWPILTVLAACSFEPQASQSTPQDGSGPIVPQDAARTAMDVAPTPHDVMRTVDACIDSDHDGVCDSVEWPCGDLPPALGSAIEDDHDGASPKVNVSSIDVDNSGQRVVGTAGETVTIELHYSISDTCGGCYDQIEYGWGGGDRIGCLYDDQPGTGGESGTAGDNPTISFKLPTSTGVYDLRINDGQNYSCTDPRGSAQVTPQGWWQAGPGSADTIAKVCVH